MSLFAFVVFCLVIISFAYLFGSDFLQKQERPWHTQFDVCEDSLSEKYRAAYPLWNFRPVTEQIESTKDTTVLILVDAWGIPIEEAELEKEYRVFESVPHKFALHQRLVNRTRHAELIEFKKFSPEAVFIFGGDSLEYGRKGYIAAMGFGEQIYCARCSDTVMLSRLDSILCESRFRTVAWTTQNSRDGDKMQLMDLLERIARLAQKHPDVRFVVQGSHRPILGTPETRRKNYSHWVPVTVLNADRLALVQFLRGGYRALYI